MTWSKWIRQAHRWTSAAFTLIVAAIFTMQGLGREPAQWIYLLPLLPLALLFLTGAWMFALPYTARRRTARQG